MTAAAVTNFLMLTASPTKASDTRPDPYGRRARAVADHGSEIPAALVLRPVCLVDPFVDRSLDGFEAHLPRRARGGDPPRLLPYRRLVPARVPPVIGADVERAV